MTDYWKTYWNDHAAAVSAAEPLRQVLRTRNRQPISEDVFQRVVAGIIETLDLATDHRVLDLCCGNGLITTRIARHCATVVGVDFCGNLLASMPLQGITNVELVEADVMAVDLPPESFDRILIAAALQHFTESQAVALFRQLSLSLKPGGLLLLTDIPDRARIWRFHDSIEREDLYFESVRNDTPVLGTWFDRDWLIRLARHAGFGAATDIEQPAEFWFSHYRFDLLCHK